MLGNQKYYCSGHTFRFGLFFLLLFSISALSANTAYTKKLWRFLESTHSDCPDSVEKFLYYNADVNAEHAPGKLAGFTPLLFAAMQGYSQIAQVLIAHGADVNAIDYQGRTAVMYAASHNNIALIKMLMQADANLRQPDDEERNALHFAVENSHVQAANLLLKYACQVNKRDVYGRSVLMKACGNGAPVLVSVLIQYGANTAYIDNRGENAMIYAIRANSAKIVEILIESGCSIHTENIYGSSYLAAAVLLDKPDICKMLLSVQADPNTIIFKEPFENLPVFVYAISNGKNSLANLLLTFHVDVNKSHPSGITPLMAAAARGDNKMVENLLKSGVNVDAVIISEDRIGQTALMWAVMYNHYDVAKLLAAASHHINKADIYGRTAVDYAILNGNVEIVQILIDNGAHSSNDTYTLAERQ